MRNKFVVIDQITDPFEIVDYGTFDSMSQALSFKKQLQVEIQELVSIVSEATLLELLEVEYVVYFKQDNGKLRLRASYYGPTKAYELIKHKDFSDCFVIPMEEWNKLRSDPEYDLDLVKIPDAI